ncbi:MAG: formylglycine-generating enzyme family protein [Alistipes sp.]|nr:formylglycine-generating enzyme family protein [Alistipes sp.]
MKNRNIFLFTLAVLIFTQCASKQQAFGYTENAYCGLNMNMVYVEGGSYGQGSDVDYEGKRTVTVDSFWIGECEVTQAQWEKIMGTTIHEQRYKAERLSGEDRPLRGVGPNYPMYNVSYAEAREFCRRLSEITGRRYELPTEAQWEYAARGGARSYGYRYSGGDSYDLEMVAWCRSNSGTRCHPVGCKRPNELGLYDMSGNLQEWCKDWYGEYSYYNRTNPQGPSHGERRVVRGGSWRWEDWKCCVWTRDKVLPTLATTYIGFRVVRLQ